MERTTLPKCARQLAAKSPVMMIMGVHYRTFYGYRWKISFLELSNVRSADFPLLFLCQTAHLSCCHAVGPSWLEHNEYAFRYFEERRHEERRQREAPGQPNHTPPKVEDWIHAKKADELFRSGMSLRLLCAVVDSILSVSSA